MSHVTDKKQARHTALVWNIEWIAGDVILAWHLPCTRYVKINFLSGLGLRRHPTSDLKSTLVISTDNNSKLRYWRLISR